MTSYRPEEALRIRKYFEAALADMAKATQCSQKDFRIGFKYALRLLREIKKSTDELSLDVLEGMAKAIHEDYILLNQPPPPESQEESTNLPPE